MEGHIVDCTLIADDLIIGAGAVANYLGMTRRQIYGCVERAHLPVFRIGALICARKSTLQSWIAAQEASTIAPQQVSPD